MVTGTVQFALAALIIVSLIWRPDGLVGRREAEDLVPGLRRRLAAVDIKPKADAKPVPDEIDTAAAIHEPLLVATGITKSFGGIHALAGVSLEIRPGEILGLIGPNGSGKTTLLNVLSGITAPDAGQVLLQGVDITGKSSFATARSGLARTFQNIRLFSHLTVRENVWAPHGSQPVEVERLLTSLNLAALGESEADTLSYGMQRRLEIARAMATQPTVILLDEPAAGMNESESDVLMEDIRTLARVYGCAIIIIDHDLRLITRLCDRIQVLEIGRTLAMGSPQSVVANPAVMAAYLGDSAALGLDTRPDAGRRE